MKKKNIKRLVRFIHLVFCFENKSVIRPYLVRRQWHERPGFDARFYPCARTCASRSSLAWFCDRGLHQHLSNQSNGFDIGSGATAAVPMSIESALESGRKGISRLANIEFVVETGFVSRCVCVRERIWTVRQLIVLCS